MQVWAALISYLGDREDMKWGEDHKEVREEMEGGARVAMVKIH